MTDSSTGGYLTPAPAPAPLQDRTLYEALQAAVVGITGLDGTLVRPRWQAEPSLVPEAATCWIAIGVTDREADVFPWLGFFPPQPAGQMNWDAPGLYWDAGLSWDSIPPAPPTYQMQRHEEFTMLASVYDLGYSGEADEVAAVLRDGLTVPQNNESLQAAGIAIVGDSDLAVAPVIFKTRWMYRVDLRVRFRRQITRYYQVLPLAGAGVELYTDDGQPPRVVSGT